MILYRIIKYFKKKYWEATIFRVGGAYPFSCDGLTAVPDKPMLFTEKELEKIYNDRNEFYKKLMQMIDFILTKGQSKFYLLHKLKG